METPQGGKFFNYKSQEAKGRGKKYGGGQRKGEGMRGKISVTPSKANIGSLSSSPREELPTNIIYSPTVPCSRKQAFNIQALGY